MAEALAAAGADIIGVSASARAGRQRGRGERVEALGRRFTAMPADLADRAAGGRLAATSSAPSSRPSTSWSTTPARSRRAPAVDHQRRRLGPRARGQPDAASSCWPRRSARRWSSRGEREDHLHRVPAQLPGRHQRRRATRRRSPASPASDRRWPTSGRPTASTSTRSRPATSPPTTRRRCATTPPARRRSCERIPAGRWGDPATSPARPCSWPRARRTTCTASSSPVDGGWLGR